MINLVCFFALLTAERAFLKKCPLDGLSLWSTFPFCVLSYLPKTTCRFLWFKFIIYLTFGGLSLWSTCFCFLTVLFLSFFIVPLLALLLLFSPSPSYYCCYLALSLWKQNKKEKARKKEKKGRKDERERKKKEKENEKKRKQGKHTIKQGFSGLSFHWVFWGQQQQTKTNTTKQNKTNKQTTKKQQQDNNKTTITTTQTTKQKKENKTTATTKTTK